VVKIPRKPAEWFSGALFARNRDHSRGLGFIFRIQIDKSLFARPVVLCVCHRFGSTKTDPCDDKDEIFFRARARVRSDAKDTFFLSKETLTGTLLTSPILADTSLVVPQRRPGPRRRESSQRRRYSDVHHQLGARGVS